MYIGIGIGIGMGMGMGMGIGMGIAREGNVERERKHRIEKREVKER